MVDKQTMGEQRCRCNESRPGHGKTGILVNQPVVRITANPELCIAMLAVKNATGL